MSDSVKKIVHLESLERFKNNLDGFVDEKVDKTTTVNGQPLSDNVTISAVDVGLGNVDNIADNEKNVNSAVKDGAENIITETYATKEELPTVNNATLTIKQDNASKGTFSANASQNVEVNIDLSGKVDKTTTVNGKSLNGNISLTASDIGALSSSITHLSGDIATSEKGANNGVATLDDAGKVPQSQLPSYVDDVLEYSKKSDFPLSGESGKIYVDTEKNLTYRWGGTEYVEISQSLALGETSSTAYAGDKGKAVADGLSSHTGNTTIHVTASDKTAWSQKYNKPSDGIPKTDLASSIQTSLGKADSALQSVSKADIGLGNVENKSSATIRGELTKSNVTTALGYTPPTTVNNATLTIKQDNASKGTFSANASQNVEVNIDLSGKVDKTTTVNGKSLNGNISLTASDIGALSSSITHLSGDIATSEKGANNGVATLDDAGKVPQSQLPSYVDDVLEYSKKSDFPLSGESGKIYVDTEKNLTYRWGGTEYVEISQSLALGETSSTAYAGDKGKAVADGLSSHTGNTTIHVTASDKTAWSQKYNKPSDGIPKTDLASSIQTSLGKADSALQSVSKADIGLGNVENKSSATIRGELTKSNVTTALGYTPPTTDTNDKVTQTETTTSANNPVVLANSTTTPETQTVKKSSRLTFNPDSGTLKVNNKSNAKGTVSANLDGNATSASKVTVNSGSYTGDDFYYPVIEQQTEANPKNLKRLYSMPYMIGTDEKDNQSYDTLQFNNVDLNTTSIDRTTFNFNNHIITNGLTRCIRYSGATETTITNGPSGLGNPPKAFVGKIQGIGENLTKQTVDMGTQIFERIYNGSSWEAWKEISNNGVAIKAAQDGNGNNIVDTYVTKNEVAELKSETADIVNFYDNYGSKNLFNVSKIYIATKNRGITWIADETSIVLTGTATSVFIAEYRIDTVSNEEYVLSAVGLEQGVYVDTYRSNMSDQKELRYPDNHVVVSNHTIFRIIVEAGKTVTNKVIKIMLCKKSLYDLDSTFVPYTLPNYELSKIAHDAVSIYDNYGSKNLFNASETFTNKTGTGITHVIDETSITLNGTATSDVTIVFRKPNTNLTEKYILCAEGLESGIVIDTFNDGWGDRQVLNNTDKFIDIGGDKTIFRIVVNINKVLSNKVIKINYTGGSHRKKNRLKEIDMNTLLDDIEEYK